MVEEGCKVFAQRAVGNLHFEESERKYLEEVLCVMCEFDSMWGACGRGV